MSEFVRKKNPFSQIPDNVICDWNLSMKARGLYTIIYRYLSIPNFNLNKQFLMSKSLEGETAFDSAWKELKKKGYLKQYRISTLKDGKNTFIYKYDLLETPNTDTPELINVKNEDEVKNISIYTEISDGDFAPHGDCIGCNLHMVENAPYAKHGVYNNIDNNNINNNNINNINTTTNTTNTNTTNSNTSNNNSSNKSSSSNNSKSNSNSNIGKQDYEETQAMEYINTKITDEEIKDKIHQLLINRKENGNQINVSVIQRIETELEGLSGGNRSKKIKILDRSISKGWSFVYELPQVSSVIIPPKKNSRGDYNGNSQRHNSYSIQDYEDNYDIMKEIGGSLDFINPPKQDDKKKEANKAKIFQLETAKQKCEQELSETTSAIEKYRLQLEIDRINSELTQLG